jgi:hypothetical protein
VDHGPEALAILGEFGGGGCELSGDVEAGERSNAVDAGWVSGGLKERGLEVGIAKSGRRGGGGIVEPGNEPGEEPVAEGAGADGVDEVAAEIGAGMRTNAWPSAEAMARVSSRSGSMGGLDDGRGRDCLGSWCCMGRRSSEIGCSTGEKRES